MKEGIILTSKGTVQITNPKTGEVLLELETTASSTNYQIKQEVLSFDNPNANRNIIKTESFPNYGTSQPMIQTYTSDSTSDWGTHQVGYPHIGTGGLTYYGEYGDILHLTKEEMESVRDAQYIWKEFLDRKIKNHEKELMSDMYGTTSVWKKIELLIDRVIFNEPATIILWKDGIKTVVKTQDGEPFDKEKGFLMAIAKYLNRDKANYNNLIKKWCPEDDEVDED